MSGTARIVAGLLVGLVEAVNDAVAELIELDATFWDAERLVAAAVVRAFVLIRIVTRETTELNFD